jgi:hypothetical protein
VNEALSPCKDIEEKSAYRSFEETVSHSFTCSRGYTYIFNSDGNVQVSYKNWYQSPVQRVHIPGSSLKEFVAELIRRERIAKLEQATTEELLDI